MASARRRHLALLFIKSMQINDILFPTAKLVKNTNIILPTGSVGQTNSDTLWIKGQIDKNLLVDNLSVSN